VKILILNNKDVMEQSLFALVTTDPGFYRPTPAWGQTRTSDLGPRPGQVRSFPNSGLAVGKNGQSRAALLFLHV
jgi:hypothetical protein